MKKKYTIAIEETIVKEYEVIANDDEEALKIAVDKYKSGIFILEPGEIQYKQMAIVQPQESVTGWHEF